MVVTGGLEIRHDDGAREARRGERQHRVQRRTVAQVQVPVVGPADDERRSSRLRPSAPSTFCPRMQLEREAHAEAGDVGADMRQSAAARGGGQIDVYPGGVLRHEARQKARRQDVIALALERALQRRRPPCSRCRRRSRSRWESSTRARRSRGRLRSASAASCGAVGEHAAHALGERVHAGAGERREIQHASAAACAPASASVSASTMRPSASVWITWMVTPLAARTTSCGR